MADAAANVVLQEQLLELEALGAVFGDDLHLSRIEGDNRRFAEAVVAAAGEASAAAAAADVPALSGTIRLPDCELAGAPVHLAFVLPKKGEAPGLQVQTNAPRSEADWLQQVASNAAAECDGQPCLLLVADRLAEAVCELAEAEAETAAAQRQRAGEQPPAASGATAGAAGVAAAGKRAQREARGLVLSRRCVWFHHIKALGKRKHIVEWGGELGLGGFSKPGFPGILLVEGRGCDVDEYLSRLRALRWQAMTVRGEEDQALGSLQELEAARRLPRGVQELGEEDMGRLAAAAREAGLEELFLTALKLSAATPRYRICSPSLAEWLCQLK